MAQTGSNWYFNIDENNVGLRGYDPVSYFDKRNDKMPEVGNEQLSFTFMDVKYLFSSKKNLSKFKSDPMKYLPKYGGWCAYRLAHKPEEEGWGQSRIPSLPTNFKIIDNELYLFSHTNQGNTKDAWNAHDEKEMISRADSFWESRRKLASMVSSKPAGLNVHARMENLLWDRFIGTWEGKGHQMVDTVKKVYSDFAPATWTFYYGYDGFCIQDDWKTEQNFGGSYNGPAIRGYDPLKQEWHMTFIPVNGGRAATWLMTGKFDEKNELEGYFEGTDWQGRSFKQKIYFYNISEDHFSWKADRSYDGGKTWIEKFTYTECDRIKS